MSDQQAALIGTAMDAQREAIVSAVDDLARKLGFRTAAGAKIGRGLPPPDVLRAQRMGSEPYLFVAHARGFTEPIHEVRHHERVHWWLRRFARLVDSGAIAGGYLVVGAYDEASAYAWASLLTKMARPHRLRRDGTSARFVVRELGPFWMAC